jgi:hypothetical protein
MKKPKPTKIKILNITVELKNSSRYIHQPNDAVSFIILGITGIADGQQISFYQVDEIFRVLKKTIDDLIFNNQHEYAIQQLKQSVSDCKHINANQIITSIECKFHFNVFYKFEFKGIVDILIIYEIFGQFVNYENTGD